MLDITQIDNKRDVLPLASMFTEYSQELGREDQSNELLLSIFTRLDTPGTLLLVATKNDSFVGFVWAISVTKFGESYLRIIDIYSKQGMVGTKLFSLVLQKAEEYGLDAVKGLVDPSRAEAIGRLFKMKEEAIFLSVEVGNELHI